LSTRTDAVLDVDCIALWRCFAAGVFKVACS
jgi:hypothetical protein